MGCYDTVMVPCPRCGKKYECQSKGGACLLRTYELDEAPDDVLSNVNRHAPYTCECGAVFRVNVVMANVRRLTMMATVVECREEEER